jgi:cathepsin D
LCLKIDACNEHFKYNAEKSSSSKIIKSLSDHNSDYVQNFLGNRDEVFINFGTGNVKCYMTEDKVCIQDLCVNDMLLLEAYYESDEPFSNVQFDGIIGLGFSHLSVNPKANFLDMLLAQNKIRRKMFSFYFNKKETENSELHIGGIRYTRIKSQINYFNVISDNYWEINLKSIYYGNLKLDICNQIKCTAIVDTGTSMIAAPSLITNQIALLSDLKQDCSNLNKLENLKFEFENGKIYELDPEYYVLKLYDDMMTFDNTEEAKLADDYK